MLYGRMYKMPLIVETLYMGVRHLVALGRRVVIPTERDANGNWFPEPHAKYCALSQLRQIVEMGTVAEAARILVGAYHQAGQGIREVLSRIESICDAYSDPEMDGAEPFRELCEQLDFEPDDMPLNEEQGEPIVGVILGMLKSFAEQTGTTVFVLVEGSVGADEGWFHAEVKLRDKDGEVYDIPLLAVSNIYEGYGWPDYAGELYGLPVEMPDSLREWIDTRDDCGGYVDGELDEYSEGSVSDPDPDGTFPQETHNLTCL